MLISRTIAMLGGRYANWCTSTRRICRNDWPYREPTRSLLTIAGLNIGESITFPSFGAKIATENPCQKGLKQTPVSYYHFWYLRLLTLVIIWPLRNISNLQCCLPFRSQYIPTALASNSENVPRQKGYLPPFGPVIPVLAADRILWQHDELCLKDIGPVIADLLVFHGDKSIIENPLTNFLYTLDGKQRVNGFAPWLHRLHECQTWALSQDSSFNSRSIEQPNACFKPK